jgi:DNA-directed RNA polymerase specialized sigma24 family protein
MREVIPTELLWRLMNASPEQFAAVERVLGVKAESRNQKAEMDDEACEDARPTTEEVARSAFALLEKLEMDAPLKAPSALTVFRLYCVQGYSAEQTARRCRCAKGTVMSRLRFIEERTGVKVEQFRAMSGHLQAIDDR